MLVHPAVIVSMPHGSYFQVTQAHLQYTDEQKNWNVKNYVPFQ